MRWSPLPARTCPRRAHALTRTGRVKNLRLAPGRINNLPKNLSLGSKPVRVLNTRPGLYGFKHKDFTYTGQSAP